MEYSKDIIQIVEDMHIKQFRRWINPKTHISLSGNMLIVSDRLFYLANELATYMKTNTDVRVIDVLEDTKYLGGMSCDSIDYLVIVGYLEKKQSYGVIDMIRQHYPEVKTVQWAMIDDCIMDISAEYNIHFKYDRYKPVFEFAKYLNEIKDKSDALMNHTK